MGRIFKALYFPQTDMCGATRGLIPSYARISINEVSWIFQWGGMWKVGDGELVRIWEDRWLPNGTPGL